MNMMCSYSEHWLLLCYCLKVIYQIKKIRMASFSSFCSLFWFHNAPSFVQTLAIKNSLHKHQQKFGWFFIWQTKKIEISTWISWHPYQTPQGYCNVFNSYLRTITYALILMELSKIRNSISKIFSYTIWPYDSNLFLNR